MRSLHCSIIITSFIVASIVLTSGCILGSAPSADASNAANTTADNMFQSFNTGNYPQFSANFSDAMARGINETAFVDMRNQIRSRYGTYASKTMTQAYNSQGYNSFVYNCTFERGTLTIRIVMNTGNPWTVEGLWFPNGI